MKNKTKKNLKKITKKIKLNKNKKEKNPLKQLIFQFIVSMIIFGIFLGSYQSLKEYYVHKSDKDITLSGLVNDIKNGKITDIDVEGEYIKIKYKNNKIVKETRKEVMSSLTETLVNYGVTPEQLSKIKIEIKDPTGFRYWFGQIAPLVIPALLIFGIIIFLSKKAGGGPGAQVFSFGSSRARLHDPNNKNDRVLFKDVAGAKEAKEELMEIVDFLKNPNKFIKMGAKIPKGVMLMGAPGCGKTLLARAVAGEAGVPFYSIAGSEFVDMFVGVGASRTRDLFAQAKKNSPAIIFIDEIDAVGRVRGGGYGGGNDEREQTLNQILVEMDGFETNEKVIVMAATNRPDVLDPALLRPGRFDRRVMVDLPDRKARKEILEVHMKNKKSSEDVDLNVIASRTPGFSGADLANLANEAAISSARKNAKVVTQTDLIDSIEKVMIGPERKSHLLSKKEKEITAYHEAGHALVATILPYSDPVHKVSIISRGRAAGYTLKLPDEDKKMQSKKEFEADIAMSLGGYIAEKEVFGDVTTGPSNDLQVLTNIARNMVTRWGMSEKLGTVTFADELGTIKTGLPTQKEFSEDTARKIDDEVKRIIDNAYNVARQILTDKREILDAIANKLIDVENLEREEYEELLKGYGIQFEQKKDIEHSDEE